MRGAIFFLMMFLGSCGIVTKTDGPVKPIGDFAMGFVSVVATNAGAPTISRKATPEELSEAVKSAVTTRLSRFEKTDSTRFYNLGIAIEGYLLAKPGVPILLSPQSVMIIKFWVWDDAKGQKIEEEAIVLNIIEEASGKSLLGSGLTQTAEEQLASLARVAASEIEVRLRKRNFDDGWFKPQPLLEKGENNQVIGPATDLEENEGGEGLLQEEAGDDMETTQELAEKTLPPLLRPQDYVEKEKPQDEEVEADASSPNAPSEADEQIQ